MEKTLKCYLTEIYLNNAIIIPNGNWEKLDRNGKKWKIAISEIYTFPEGFFVCTAKSMIVNLDKAGHPEHFEEWKSTKIEF